MPHQRSSGISSPPSIPAIKLALNKNRVIVFWQYAYTVTQLCMQGNKVLSCVNIYFTSFLILFQSDSTISVSRPLQNNDPLFVHISQYQMIGIITLVVFRLLGMPSRSFQSGLSFLQQNHSPDAQRSTAVELKTYTDFRANL